MLTVRSEGQLVRDKTAGEDLLKVLNANGYQTTWLLVRYLPPQTSEQGHPCPQNPPLSWHLTLTEQSCIDAAWDDVRKRVTPEVASFLKGTAGLSGGSCTETSWPGLGVFERTCPAASVPPSATVR
jgi:hypothetical protein